MTEPLTTEIRLQQHPAECGAACLGIILEWMGNYQSTSHLRTLCGVNRDGATVAQLQKGAFQLGYKSIVKKKGLNALKKLNRPIILHWNLSHFVVLEQILEEKVYVNDPARGRRILSIDKLAEHFTGVCIEIEDKPSNEGEGANKFSFYDFLLPVFKQKATKFVLLPGIIFMVLEVIYAGLFHAYYDIAIANNLKNWVAIIGLSGIITIGLSWLINRISLKLQLYLNQDAEYRFNQSIIQNLSNKDIDFFDSHYDGEISHKVSGLRNLSNKLGQAVFTFFDTISITIVSLILILLINPPLFVVTIIPYLLLLVYRFKIKKQVKELTIEKSRVETEFNGHLNQRLFDLKRFGLMGMRFEILSPLMGRVFPKFTPDFELKKFLARYQTVSQTIDSVTPALILFCSCYLLIKGELSYGAYSFTYMLSLTVLPKIKQFQGHVDEYLNSKDIAIDSAAYYQTEEVIEETEVDVDAKDPKALFQLIDMGFGYNGIDCDLFQRKNLIIYKKDVLCLVGNSGSGKSTLFDLLSGQRKPITGYALYKGKPAFKNVDVGFVFANEEISGSLTEFLFSGNKPDVNKMKQVLKLVELDRRLGFHAENNSNTPLEPEQFSAGELQRLSLARALCYHSEVLFFDEAFSHVDAETSKRIIERLKQQGVTLIMVSHRSEISQLADYQFEVE
ncbi:ATP-binding cassette domain-containing protein [Parashewanella curva]|uniref:ATP-binding cassette domain-containing protein n=1 Tax=Parashewanella curva TaxID=2338552 RepID=A0A3L8PUF8_9GAMM|nr:cysteine peptidase family C39 domain-containing protein [Parashewanella curva]RLV59057.1 ATP-binding cassette domain-containing protein [Parashewanella curva]